MRVFTGLTLLTRSRARSARCRSSRRAHPHEGGVHEHRVHGVGARESYSSIFSTLCSTKDIDDAFRWSVENENLQKKAAIVMEYYQGDSR